MHRNAVAIPIAMLFVALSMMMLGLGAVPAFEAFRTAFWLLSPLLGLVGLVIAYRNLRHQQRAIAAAQQEQAADER